MGETTAIGWTDHTFNPWWGCTKIEGPNGTGSACDHCYAATFAKRTGHDVWGKDGDRRFFGDKHWNEPLKWERDAAAGKPGPNTGRPDHLVFCASMADVFEARDDLNGERERLWRLIDVTPHLTWLLLTKRPEQVLRRTPWAWRVGQNTSPPHREDRANWPRNVWIGTTVEDQARADLRIPRLAKIPAPVRFLSCEPLLGPIDLGVACCACSYPPHTPGMSQRERLLAGLDRLGHLRRRVRRRPSRSGSRRSTISAGPVRSAACAVLLQAGRRPVPHERRRPA